MQQLSQAIISISIGAIFGAYLRFKIALRIDNALGNKSLATFLINMASTFSLGLFSALYPLISSSNPNFYLFFVVGFLGSLSTFSTLMIELLNHLRFNRLFEFFTLSIMSLFGGVLAAFLGFKLING